MTRASFTLTLFEAAGSRRIDGVRAFIGEDHSGSFGILAGHTRLITVLTLGMARYQSSDGRWHYLAMLGGVLRFDHDELSIATRHSLQDDDYQRLSARLADELRAEEQALAATRSSMKHMEQGLLQRLMRNAEGGWES